MDLEGHRRITARAMELLPERLGAARMSSVRSQLFSPASNADEGGMASRELGPPDFAVQRDILDVITLGHWRDRGQRHHFMRTRAQTNRQAYDAACGWIERNATSFARAVSRGHGKDHLQALGNALHAAQDSFSASHVTRELLAPERPGHIVDIDVYAEQDHTHHAAADVAWLQMPWLLDLAALASATLVELVIDEAGQQGRGLDGLRGFPAYREQWLRASPTL